MGGGDYDGVGGDCDGCGDDVEMVIMSETTSTKKN